MAETETPEPQVAPQARGRMHEQPCARCGKMATWEVPMVETINTKLICGVIMPHPDVQACPHCGQAHQIYVQGFKGVAFSFVPMKMSEEPMLVLANSIPKEMSKK